MGKLFTSIINNRLTVFSDQVELLEEKKQKFGFRQGYSTIDTIFVLHILLELLKGTHKKYIVILLTLKNHLIMCGVLDYDKNIKF